MQILIIILDNVVFRVLITPWEIPTDWDKPMLVSHWPRMLLLTFTEADIFFQQTTLKESQFSSGEKKIKIFVVAQN